MRTLSLRETLATYWLHVQHELLPWLDDAVGPLGEHHKQLVAVLGMSRIEGLVPSLHGLPGRPESERAVTCSKQPREIHSCNSALERWRRRFRSG